MKMGSWAMKTKLFYLLAVLILAIACWWFALHLFGTQNAGLLSAVPLALVSTRIASRIRRRAWVYAGLLILVGLLAPTDLLMGNTLDTLPPVLGAILAVTLFLLPSLAIILAAMLLSEGLRLYQAWRNASAAEAGASPRQAGRDAAIVLILSTLLIAKTLYNLYWLLVWDSTYDPLDVIWMYAPVLAVLYAAVLLAIVLRGKTRLAGLMYALVITALVAVFTSAKRVDFRQFTQARAEQVSRAIETYYARAGRYPQSLQQLVPWHVLSIPEPVIIYGQGWCYDGGEAYYRLGYVYREHWSDPHLIGRMYKTQGEVPDLPPLCDAEIDALRQQHPDFYVLDGE